MAKIILSALFTILLVTGNVWSQGLSIDPVSTDVDCLTPGPLNLGTLEAVVPNCLAQRVRSTTAEELIANDSRFCECARNSPLIQATITPANRTASMTLLDPIPAVANNSALEILSESSDVRNTQIRLMTQTGQETRESQRLKEQRKQESADQINNEPVINEFIADVNAIPSNRSTSQCVTFLEFHAQRSIPNENAFFEDLSSITEFRANDWDFEHLGEIYSSASPEEKPRIEARMKFLSRHPAIRAVFSMQNAPEFPSLNQKKQELFGLIKRLTPPAGSVCFSKVNGCWSQIQRLDQYDAFRDGISNFMVNPDVNDIVSRGMAIRNIRYYGMMLNPMAVGSMRFTPQSYMTALQYQDQNILNSCIGSDADSTCYARLAGHCDLITSMAQVNPGDDLMSRLETEESFHGSMMPDSNPDFQAFNEMICNRPYQNTAGNQMNFFQYQQQKCSSGKPSPSCADRKELLKQFMRDYPIGGDEGTQNIRAGLSDSLERTKLQSVDAATIRTINGIVEAPRALRERFGGEIPAIDKSGQLQKFVASASAGITGGKTSLPSSAASGGDKSSASADETERSSPSSGLLKEIRSLRDEIQNRRIERTREPSYQDNFARSEIPDEPRNSSFRENQNTNTFQPQRNFPEATQNPTGGGFRNPEQPRNEVPNAPATSAAVPSSRPESLAPTSTGRTTGGGGTIAAPGAVSSGAGGSTSIGSRSPLVEVSPRRGGGGGNVNRSPASVPEPDAPTSFDFRPVIPVTLNPQQLQSALSDPQSLANDEAIMEKVNASSESVVRLGLRVAGGSEDTVVYAIKEGDSVRFSLVNPSDRPLTRPVLNANEMNIRVPDQTMFAQIQTDPSSLRNYNDIIRAAAELPGLLVRLNVISASGESLTVYLDKRRSVPTFSLTEPRSR